MAAPESRTVSRSTIVDAPPEAVFELLADPRRHAEFDGSGTVKAGISGPSRLSLGSTFGTRMRIVVPYVIRNTVVEFEEGRRIGWRHFGRHIWRYELEPAPGGGTRVTETFDWRGALLRDVYDRTGVPAANARSIKKTLARLQERVSA
jgi:uncharacterized protein YndB with AHSA1/START domain